MKKNLLLVVLLAPIFSVLCALPADAASVVSSTSTAVAWPDYSTKPWTLANQVDFIATLSYKPKANDLIVGEGRFDVRIGTISTYFNAPNEEQATMAVMIGEILGNGSSLRRMFVVDVGPVDFQINVNGKWTSVPPGCSVKFVVLNEDLVVNKNTMTGVAVVVTDGDGKVVMRVVFKNKASKK